MLQQTQVATVLGYYERFLKTCPTVADLAIAEDDTVMALWAGLGYYSRARNLHKAAKLVVERHGGTFPNDVAALAELPGVGRSTASAIAAFSFDTIAPILDGNVKRVLARHAGIEGFPGASAVEKKLWVEAEARLPGCASDMVAYTQGLMDLGATICAKSTPSCLLCPVSIDCRARIDGRLEEIPAAKPNKPLPHRSQRYLIAQLGDAVLLVKRPPIGIWGGLWCLPELGANDANPHDSRFVRQLETRFAITVAAETHELEALEHSFTHFKLRMLPIRVTIKSIHPRIAESGETMWLPLANLATTGLPTPIKKILTNLESRAI